MARKRTRTERSRNTRRVPRTRRKTRRRNKSTYRRSRRSIRRKRNLQRGGAIDSNGYDIVIDNYRVIKNSPPFNKNDLVLVTDLMDDVASPNLVRVQRINPEDNVTVTDTIAGENLRRIHQPRFMDSNGQPVIPRTAYIAIAGGTYSMYMGDRYVDIEIYSEFEVFTYPVDSWSTESGEIAVYTEGGGEGFLINPQWLKRKQ